MVFANQTLTFVGRSAPAGELALLDGALRLMPGATLVLENVHATHEVAVDPGGRLLVQEGSLWRISAELTSGINGIRILILLNLVLLS
jgi:hypothetical protein